MKKTKDSQLYYYQKEINSLREEGESFAQAFPQIAGRLSWDQEKNQDPHIERLIQSIAFLTGRIRQDLDQEHERLSDTLLDTLYPQMLNPIPSISVARFMPSSTMLPPFPQLIEKEHPLTTQNMEGTKCYFRTCYPVELWPLKVAQATLNVDDVSKTSELIIDCIRTDQESESAAMMLSVDTLQFYIQGNNNRRNAYALYEMLFANCLEIIVTDIEDEDQEQKRNVEIQPVGFSSEETVLPYPPNMHQGYRLLQEYFACPEKYMFFKLCFPKPMKVKRGISFRFVFKNRSKYPIRVNSDTFQLGCTPIINVFEQVSEPLRINDERSEHPIIVDQLSNHNVEIHSVLSISSLEKSSTISLPHYLSPLPQKQDETQNAQSNMYWFVHRAIPQYEQDKSTLTLGLVDNRLQTLSCGNLTLYAKLLCTNGNQTIGLEQGSLLFSESGLSGMGIELCHQPSVQIPSPKGSSRKMLVSMLSLNHLSIISGPRGLEALKVLLSTFNFEESSISNNFLECIIAIHSQSAMMRIHSKGRAYFCSGIDIEMVLDPEVDGDSAFLLGSILDRFFALYANINTVTRLTLRRGQNGYLWKQWQPRCGNTSLL